MDRINELKTKLNEFCKLDDNSLKNLTKEEIADIRFLYEELCMETAEILRQHISYLNEAKDEIEHMPRTHDSSHEEDKQNLISETEQYILNNQKRLLDTTYWKGGSYDHQ